MKLLGQMLSVLCNGLVILSLLISASTTEAGYTRCNCDSDSFWNVETVFQCQKVADFLIATAYFSIPLELLYFTTCANLFPFKWIVLQFGAFIVLCGLTHLLNVFTFEPHSFQLMLSLTISKFLTALVSFATAITLLTLIPQLLQMKVRENFLRLKARELDREVGLMKRQEEASWHVRMLTQEIRKSLDRHTILYTTLVELSNTLALQNCAVWMPDENMKEMRLTHELKQTTSSALHKSSIPIDDPDVLKVIGAKDAKVLDAESTLGSASSGGLFEFGAVAAIRMPLLKASDFKGGTPQVVEARYAILVLALPRDNVNKWSNQELDIIEVVADQVAVALSHAAVLEESQLMREKLEEQNRALLQARQNLLANEARNKFQIAISQGMRRPINSILSLQSVMQQENLSPEQRLCVDAITKNSAVVSTLIDDVVETTVTSDRLSLVMKPFSLHSMIKEAICAARCLCNSGGFGFGFQVETTVPEQVVGDEKRIFHVLLHMVGTLLNGDNVGKLTFRVLRDDKIRDKEVQEWMHQNLNFSDEYSSLMFEVAITPSVDESLSLLQFSHRYHSEEMDAGLSFKMCKRLVQMMQGNLWLIPNSRGTAEIIMLLLRFKMHSHTTVSDTQESTDLRSTSLNNIFKGLGVLLADSDDVNRAVTRKLLKQLGCWVSSCATGFQCLNFFGTPGTPFRVVLLDLELAQMDGFEVSMQIRKFRSRPWPVIVALTASADGEVWQKCLQAGMNGLILKPVTLQAIADELSRVLRNT